MIALDYALCARWTLDVTPEDDRINFHDQQVEASVTLPQLHQRPVRAPDRIGLRQLHFRNRLQRLRVVFRRRPRDLHRRAGRIGADNGEIARSTTGIDARCRRAGSRRRRRRSRAPCRGRRRTARCVAARDAEHFMHGRVVVQIIVDAVAPHRAPAIGAEQSLDGLLGMIVARRRRRACRPGTASACSAPGRRRRSRR